MKLKNIIFYICSLILIVGCYKDKGNYSYSDIGSVLISGIEKSYSCYRYERLKLTPEIETSGVLKGVNYAYHWEIDGEEVSNDRNLDYVIEQQFRDKEYLCRYTVENLDNGAKYYKTFSITLANLGIFVLSELDNKKANLSFAPASSGDEISFVDNIFEKENGFPIEGKALNIEVPSGYDDYPGKHIFITTSKGGHLFNIDYMKMTKMYDGNRMLEPEPNVEFERIAFLNYGDVEYGAAVNSKGQIYPIRGVNDMFSLPSIMPCPVYNKPTEPAYEYRLSPYFINITFGWSGSPSGILAYDDLNGRFLRFRSVYGSKDNDQMVNADLRASIPGYKMAYMGVMNSNYNHCSLLRDDSYSSFKIIPKHSTTFATTTAIYDLDSHNIKPDSKFLTSKDKELLYYSSGDAIYKINLYDVPTFESTKVSIKGFPTGVTINFIKYNSILGSDEEMVVGVKNKGVDEIYIINHFKLEVTNVISGYAGTAVDIYMKFK